jgi:hypothetical protein
MTQRLGATCVHTKSARRAPVDAFVRRRTLNQNAYLWGCVYKLICDYTGDEPEDFHEWAKGKFLGKRTVSIRGEEQEVTRSTTELSKEEFFDVYVDPIRRWAAEYLEVVVPDPDRVFV